MDDILLFLFVPLIAIAGWIAGIVGWFRAGRALREIAALRRELAEAGAAGATLADAVLPPRVLDGAVSVGGDDASSPGVGDGSSLREEPPSAEPGTVAPGPIAAAPPAGRPKLDIEALLTMRWGLWLGAVALLMAGVFLIRYAADQGLLGPATRCAIAGLLGVSLLAGAAFLRRPPSGVTGDDASPWGRDQAPAALAAGGIAILFGAAYGCGPFYGLLSSGPAFILLAAVSLGGIATSLRFGKLVAAVGIAGAFVTPLLVQTADPSLPGLFAYLLTVAAASLAVVRYSAWTWLGWTTTIACAAWTVAGGLIANDATIWAPSLFVPAAAALNLFLLPPAALSHPVGRRLAWVPFASLAAAGLLIAAAHDADWPRAGVLLLIPLSVGKGAREPRLDRLPWLASQAMLLCLLLWDLPSWQPTGQTIDLGGNAPGILPGAFAPEAILPFLLTAAAAASVLAVSGLLLERRAPRPLHWAALPAAVPVLTLAVAYTQVSRLRPSVEWGLASLVLACLLVAATDAARREGDQKRAGAHAAGAVGAIALGCAMVLRDQWLSVAIALVLPPLAWIEARSLLAALRLVARVIASLVLVRLVLNWYVLDYDFGTGVVVTPLLASYLAPAIGFGLAARSFRKGQDDATVALLEAGAVLFVVVLVALSIKRWQGGGNFRAPVSLEEVALRVGTIAAQAYVNLRLGLRTGRRVLLWAAWLQGGLSLAAGFVLLAVNPMLLSDGDGWLTLIAGYMLPALIAAASIAVLPGGRGGRVLGAYAVLAGLVSLMLAVRLLFHPNAMSLWTNGVDAAELWAWSGAGLAYGAALMGLGIARQREPGGKALRLAALAIIGLMAAKVFLIDMAGLEGLWRVVSFLGLGLMLIALGTIYRRFVAPPVDTVTLRVDDQAVTPE